MRWQFWQGSKELPGKVQGQLLSQFRLNPQVVAKMRCVTKSGQFAGRPVRRIRIFDPALITDGSVHIHRYDGLNGHTESLLFEGHIEKGDRMYLADRRPTKSAGQ